MRRRAGFRSFTTLALALTLALTLAACAGAATDAATNSAASHPTVTRTPHATPVKLPGAWTAAYAPNAAEELRFAPSNPSLTYLCADNGPAAAPLSNTPQLYGSQGREWYQLTTPAMRPVPDPAQTAASCDIFIDAQNPKDIFFQQDEDELQGAGRVIAQQLARSRDGGATWSALTPITNSAGFADIAVVGSRLVGRIYPVVFGGVPCTSEPTPKATSLIYASDDGGATWNPIGQSIEAAGYSVTDMAMAGTTLFALSAQVPPILAGWRPLLGAAPHTASLVGRGLRQCHRNARWRGRGTGGWRRLSLRLPGRQFRRTVDTLRARLAG